MNQNPSRTLWLSIGLALFAVFLIYSYSQEKVAEYNKKFGAQTQVVVAAKEIYEMQTIDETMLKIISVPQDFQQPGAIVNPEEIVGLVASAPFQEGEQILNTKLLKPGPTTGLSIQVSPNKRAVTIPVDDVRGLANLLRPGDRVDILGVNEGKEGKDASVNTLLQDVVVLATGVNVTNNIPRALDVDSRNNKSFKNLKGDTSFSNITVELSPKEAQDIILMLASNPGSIYLTLRNPNDRTKNSLPPSDLSSVGGTRPSFNFESPRVPAAFVPPSPAPAPSVNSEKPASNNRRGFVEVR